MRVHAAFAHSVGSVTGSAPIGAILDAVAVTFTLVGAAFELAGVVTIVFDIWKAGRQLRAYRERPQTIYLGAISDAGAKVGNLSMSGGQEPTLDESVRVIEAKVDLMIQGQGERDEKLRDRWRDEIAAAEQRSRDTARDRDDALEKLVVGASVGVPWWRVAGVVAVSLGIVLQATGSVLSF